MRAREAAVADRHRDEAGRPQRQPRHPEPHLRRRARHPHQRRPRHQAGVRQQSWDVDSERQGVQPRFAALALPLRPHHQRPEVPAGAPPRPQERRRRRRRHRHPLPARRP